MQQTSPETLREGVENEKNRIILYGRLQIKVCIDESS